MLPGRAATASTPSSWTGSLERIGMSTELFLYLETRGRKTGKRREIEIWYVELGGSFYVVAEKREQAHWVKNLRACPDVSFSVGSRRDRESQVRRTAARARVIDDAAEPEPARQVRTLMDQKYGWSDGLVVAIAPET
jgi:deazaflavin-dependent oxidoreductase (nitroreductase family)